MTRPVCVSIPHEIGAAEARRRIESGFDRLLSQSSGGLTRLERSWEGDRLAFSAKALGQGITGRLDVLEREVRLELDLPTALAVIANAFTSRLRKEGQLLLQKK